MDLNKFMNEGYYLPPSMRDFHDQKEIFKCMSEIIDKYSDQGYAKKISWIDLHCYTIDVFLWFMAHHGYVLKKMPEKKQKEVGCSSLKDRIEDMREKEFKILSSIMNKSGKS